MSTLRRVVSILQEYSGTFGMTVDEICETICDSLEIEKNEAIKNKVIRAIMKGISYDLLCEDRGRYMINKLHRNCLNMLPSVPSFMEYGVVFDNRIGQERYCSNCSNCTRLNKRTTNRNLKRITIDNSYTDEIGEFSGTETPRNFLYLQKKQRRKESVDRIRATKKDITLDEAFSVIRRTVRENKKRLEQIKKQENKAKSSNRTKQKSKFTSRRRRSCNDDKIFDNQIFNQPGNNWQKGRRCNKNFNFGVNTINLDDKFDFMRDDLVDGTRKQKIYNLNAIDDINIIDKIDTNTNDIIVPQNDCPMAITDNSVYTAEET